MSGTSNRYFSTKNLDVEFGKIRLTVAYWRESGLQIDDPQKCEFDNIWLFLAVRSSIRTELLLGYPA